MANEQIALTYTGGGYGGFLPGIPARDLTAEEVAALGGEAALLASGLYVRPQPTGLQSGNLK